MAAPDVARNVPARQGTGVVVCTGQYRPGGQDKQSATLLALGVIRYVLAAQLIGALEATGQK